MEGVDQLLIGGEEELPDDRVEGRRSIWINNPVDVNHSDAHRGRDLAAAAISADREPLLYRKSAS